MDSSSLPTSALPGMLKTECQVCILLGSLGLWQGFLAFVGLGSEGAFRWTTD